MLKRWFFTKIAYRMFKNEADTYVNNKEKSRGLVSRATSKAFKNEPSFKGMWNRLQLLFELIKAWASGKYREIPYRSLVMILIGIVYFVSPVDFIPDFLFGFGILDDVAVLGFIVRQVDHDLNDFRAWKDRNNHLT